MHDVTDVRPFVPARDFAISRAFHEALGSTTVWSSDDLAMLELAGHRFMLQDVFVRAWAEHSMMAVEVADAAAWHRRVADALARGRFGDARVAEPAAEDYGALVTHVWDPSGVLLHVTQWLSDG